MTVIYKRSRRAVVVETNRIKVIDAAVQGPAAIPPAAYSAHMESTENPHSVGLLQLLVPPGCDGQWVRFSDDGQSLIPTPAPLTELPPMPEPVDEKVRASPTDPVSGYLNSKVAGLVYVDETRHVMAMRGVTDGVIPPMYYYGTNDAGEIGFWPLPGGLVHVCGITPDKEEWLDMGESGLYAMP